MTIDPNNLSSTAQMTFNDDFNSLSLWNGTSGTWTTGDSYNNAKGFTLSGNGEQEWYINSNYAPTQNIQPWSVSDGALNLVAQPTDDATKAIIGDHPYTSGQVNTFNSFSQTYGYFEMRAELPQGAGLWPAFWLLPENNQWPPEIDVMENLGDNMNKYYTTDHTAETGSHTMSTTNITTADLSAAYHNYGVDWESDKITWYFDGKQVFQVDTPADMHDPMYMVANLAVGGYWPGYPTSASEFPADMKIDYIRAYSDNPNAPVFTPTGTDAHTTTPGTTATTPPPTDSGTPTPTPTPVPTTDTTHPTDPVPATDQTPPASTPPATTPPATTPDAPTPAVPQAPNDPVTTPTDTQASTPHTNHSHHKFDFSHLAHDQANQNGDQNDWSNAGSSHDAVARAAVANDHAHQDHASDGADHHAEWAHQDQSTHDHHHGQMFAA